MKRILMMVLRNIILVPFMWCKLCYHAHHVDKYTEEEHYKMLKFIVRRANKGGNVTIAAEGLDNIPKENGFMFFPNHQGMYDVLAIMDVCPVPISVVAKKEVAQAAHEVKGELTYDDKVIQKIIGLSLEKVSGLLAVDGGFFSNLADKLINTDNVTNGVNVEVGKEQVAVDLNVIVEYQKNVPELYKKIKEVVVSEISKMTDLEVVEVNVDVVDIKTKEQHEADSVSLQDRVTGVVESTSEFTSDKFESAKQGLSDGFSAAKEKVSEGVEAVSEATAKAEPRVH